MEVRTAKSVRSPRSGANGRSAESLGVPDQNSAGLRLLDAERAEDIYPVLLEEIIRLGYPRALVAHADLETGAVIPSVVLNCSQAYRQRFKTTLYALEHPLAQILLRMQPSVLPPGKLTPGTVYCHPIWFADRHPCREAERERSAQCLAQQNSRFGNTLKFDQQVCGLCGMQGYASVVAVDIECENSGPDMAALAELIKLANRYLTRLFKVEHYFHYMTDIERNISHMDRMMQSVLDPIILTDTQHRVLIQNKAAERFFKLTDDETSGRAHAVQMNNLFFSAALSSMAVSGETSRDLTLVNTFDGEEVLFEAVCAPALAPEGHTIGMVSVLRDVTDLRRADVELRVNYEKLRRAEEVLRQDRDRLNLVFEHVGDPIIVCDSSAKVVLMDPLAKKLLGSQEEEDDDPQRELRLKNQAQFDAYVTSFTYSFDDRQTRPLRLTDPAVGSEVAYDARSGKIYNLRDRVEYTVTVLRDVTALKKIEQLRMEQKLLMLDKFAATGRLAATIAHEVNNPMEAIKNAIYLLGKAIDPQATPVYAILKSETERVARIVRQMLGLYRSTPQIGPVKLGTLIEDLFRFLDRELQRSGVQTTVDLATVPDALCSIDQLRQVLSNLVLNARDGMPRGGTILLRTRPVPREGPARRVRLLIADTGCGIPRDILPNIFEAFVTTKGERGTGLGLWISKNIIENHGGTIRVKSRIGRGTVFKIDLPIAQ